MSPMELCFEHCAPYAYADRSQVISMSSEGRSQEERGGLCSRERVSCTCIGKRATLPVSDREQRFIWPLAVGRHPAGGNVLPTS